jgi:hypothetical protein
LFLQRRALWCLVEVLQADRSRMHLQKGLVHSIWPNLRPLLPGSPGQIDQILFLDLSGHRFQLNCGMILWSSWPAAATLLIC